MTANRMTTVWCDGEPGAAPMSCGEWEEGDTAPDVRRALKRAGWQVGLPGGIDRCPQHAERRAVA